MPACPSCHVYKGLFSPLSRKDGEVYVCSIDHKHAFKRDKEGNFHSV